MNVVIVEHAFRKCRYENNILFGKRDKVKEELKESSESLYMREREGEKEKMSVEMIDGGISTYWV